MVVLKKSRRFTFGNVKPRLASLQFSGAVDGGANVPVSPTAADVAAHGFVDIGVGRLGLFREQRSRAHDLPGLAIAALGNVLFDPGHLDGMAAIGRESLNGGHRLAGHVLDLGHAGARGVAVATGIAQAPHMAMPQPNLVPVMLSVSRRTHSRGISGTASTVCSFPLRVNLIDGTQNLLPRR